MTSEAQPRRKNIKSREPTERIHALQRAAHTLDCLRLKRRRCETIEFTCKDRHLCPACHQHRVRQTADWIAKYLLHHTFSLQKITG